MSIWQSWGTWNTKGSGHKHLDCSQHVWHQMSGLVSHYHSTVHLSQTAECIYYNIWITWDPSLYASNVLTPPFSLFLCSLFSTEALVVLVVFWKTWGTQRLPSTSASCMWQRGVSYHTETARPFNCSDGQSHGTMCVQGEAWVRNCFLLWVSLSDRQSIHNRLFAYMPTLSTYSIGPVSHFCESGCIFRKNIRFLSIFFSCCSLSGPGSSLASRNSSRIW